MPVRRFDGSDDEIRCAIGATDGLTDITLVAVVRRGSDTTLDPLISQYNAEESFQRNFHVTGSDKVGLQQAGSGDSGGTAGTVLSSQGWVLVAASKAAGEAKPRMHRTILETLEHVHHDGDVTVADAPSLAGGEIRLCRVGTAWGHFDAAAFAIFDKALSDEEIEALAEAETLADWLTSEPVYMVAFDQGSVEEAVNDLTEGGADQTSRTGTEVIEEDPPIPYGAEEEAPSGPPVGSKAMMGVGR